MPEPIRVCITGAAGQIGYSLTYMIGSGYVFGKDTPVILQLLDIPPAMTVLEGVSMELEDCALPTIKEIIRTDDPAVGFKDVDAAFLVASMPIKEGMERSDLLAANFKIFKTQGEALDKHAKKTVKVVVVGNPVNTNCLVCSMHAPSIPKENFSALMRLDQNRTQQQIALRVGVPVENVKRCVVWGNHSSSMYPDVRHAVVKVDGKDKPVLEAVGDEAWLNREFIDLVRDRWHQVHIHRKNTSAMSAAKATCDHMKDWFLGTPEGCYASMAVISEGQYGTPPGVFFSFPVTIKDRKWTIVPDLPMNDFAKEKLETTSKDLLAEKEVADKLKAGN